MGLLFKGKNLEKKVALLALFLCSSMSVQAHNVWLEKTAENKKIPSYVVKFGHETTEPYPLSKLTSVTKFYPHNGQLVEIKSSSQFLTSKADKNKGELLITPETSLVFLTFDNGIWSKLPSGKYVEKTKQEAPDAEFSINPIKLGKAILMWNDEAFKAHQQTYELVPQNRPKAGEPLAILVLKAGKPIQGIKVGLGEDKPFQLSDENGIAYFTPTEGFNKVWAEFEEKVVDNPLYTDRAYEYMLTFDVEKFDVSK